jgi:UDP-MurNAc hydroxylase
MKVVAYGHACLKVLGGSAPGAGACLFDPWFSRSGAFFSGWFQFPENLPLLDAALEDVVGICVSHNHADHFDAELLRGALAARPALRVHLARFATPWFVERARRLLAPHADRVVEHEPWEEFEASPGVRVFFVPEESPAQIDAAMVVVGASSTLVNLNDARLTSAQLARIRARVGAPDVLALQASGASEYPMNYLYPPEAMAERGAEKRRLKLEHARAIIAELAPHRIFFFAGPPVFLDESLARFNTTGPASVFPDQLDILDHFREHAPDVASRALCVLPGEELCDERLWTRTDRREARLDPYTHKADYLAAYALRRADLTSHDRGELPSDSDILEHLSHLATVSPWAAEKIGGALVFEIVGRSAKASFTVDFATRTARRGGCATPLYVLTAPAASVAAVIAGEATWDDVFLSLRMTFDERTDRFVAHFKTLLKYPDPAVMNAVEAHESRAAGSEVAMITVRSGDGEHCIQRLCPHAGADLSVHGQIDGDATITCLAHRFRFDLRTGACLNARGYSLRVLTPLESSRVPGPVDPV